MSFWSLNVPGIMNLLSLYGKEQHEHSTKHLDLCSMEENESYRFGTTWGWINDIFVMICTSTSYADLQGRKRDYRSAWILMNAMLLQIKAVMQFFLCPLAVIQLVCVRFRACALCGDKWKWWRKCSRTWKMCLTPKWPWNTPSCFGYTSENAASFLKL